MYINVVLEDVFQSHHGHDLFDTDKSMDALRKFKQKRADTVSQLLETLAEALVSEIMIHGFLLGTQKTGFDSANTAVNWLHFSLTTDYRHTSSHYST